MNALLRNESHAIVVKLPIESTSNKYTLQKWKQHLYYNFTCSCKGEIHYVHVDLSGTVEVGSLFGSCASVVNGDMVSNKPNKVWLASVYLRAG